MSKNEGFEWRDDLKKYQCLDCSSLNVEYYQYGLEARIRTDCDGELHCNNCGQKEII